MLALWAWFPEALPQVAVSGPRKFPDIATNDEVSHDWKFNGPLAIVIAIAMRTAHRLNAPANIPRSNNLVTIIINCSFAGQSRQLLVRRQILEQLLCLFVTHWKLGEFAEVNGAKV
jgi:hypothetical protein